MSEQIKLIDECLMTMINLEAALENEGLSIRQAFYDSCLQALTNSLFTALKRFDCLVNAALEIVQLTNPHIHVNSYNFLISDIRIGFPLITFKPNSFGH